MVKTSIKYFRKKNRAIPSPSNELFGADEITPAIPLDSSLISSGVSTPTSRSVTLQHSDASVLVLPLVRPLPVPQLPVENGTFEEMIGRILNENILKIKASLM